MQTKPTIAFCTFVLAGWFCTSSALGNGGPFVVKYPSGDPAAKGVLARFDRDLKPGREERLRVIKEDLKIVFVPHGTEGPVSRKEEAATPLAIVSAEYTIENPTSQTIDVDFGFPILRGIYLHPLAMMPMPDVQVKLNGKENLRANVITNSGIYGMIRQMARETIEKAVAADPALAELVAKVRATSPRSATTVTAKGNPVVAKSAAPLLSETRTADHESAPETRTADHESARSALGKYLQGSKKWSQSDAALMVEFASCDVGPVPTAPADRTLPWQLGYTLAQANLGPLRAIGEQKATQFFARLASCFDPKAGSTYEGIFTAWGGDVRERSVDLQTGQIRPREIVVDPKQASRDRGDPTVYARVDYRDPNVKLPKPQEESCDAILKNLPVIFTFAPMNLIHYKAAFPPNATQTLTVRYKQYAYKDTHEPVSHQLAYVLHPASMWKDFGPIHLEVAVPEGIAIRASVACPLSGVEEVELSRYMDWNDPAKQKVRCSVYKTTLTDKTGELFIAMDAAAWSKASAKQEGQKAANASPKPNKAQSPARQ